MKTPTPAKGVGAVRCLSGDSALSSSLVRSQHLRAINSPSIIVDGCIIRIIGGADSEIGVPRRQGFAWASNARDYAKRLSAERGWPIEAGRRG